jgi:hypothetical protein
LTQPSPRRIHLSTPHSVPDRCRSTPASTLPISVTSVLRSLRPRC